MSKEELKPCPFCGHKPHLEHDRIEPCRNLENGDLITRWRVICPNCGIKIEGGATEYYFSNEGTIRCKKGYNSQIIDGRSRAIDLWNTRTITPDIVDKISQELQNAEFTEASKWLDCKYEI